MRDSARLSSRSCGNTASFRIPVVIGTVVFAAGFLPARSASRVAPMEALRYE